MGPQNEILTLLVRCSTLKVYILFLITFQRFYFLFPACKANVEVHSPACPQSMHFWGTKLESWYCNVIFYVHVGHFRKGWCPASGGNVHIFIMPSYFENVAALLSECACVCMGVTWPFCFNIWSYGIFVTNWEL